MASFRARVRGMSTADFFLSYRKALSGSRVEECPGGRRCVVVRETVVGDLLFWRAVLTECLAVFLFVLLATGSSVAWPGSQQAPSNLHVSMSFGLVIASIIHCFGDVSGAHLNPAVTVPFMVYREISVIRGLMFIFAQCLGAYFGAAVLRAVTPLDAARYDDTLGCTLLGEGITSGRGFVVEFVASFQLIFTVFSTTDPRRKDTRIPPALAIGVSVAIGLLFAIPFTGASMNPARSFGPALSAGNWNNHWLYWVAPILAGLVASISYRHLFAPGTLINEMTVTQTPVPVHGQRTPDHGSERNTVHRHLGGDMDSVGERLAFTSFDDVEFNNNLPITASKSTDV